MTKFLEIRNARTFELIDKQVLKNKRHFKKICKAVTKIILEYHKNNKTILTRHGKNSYLIKCGKYGFVVGIKEMKRNGE